MAKLKKWYPGISIHQYVVLRKIWKIVNLFCNLVPYNDLMNYLNKKIGISQTKKILCNIIFSKWNNEHLLIQALPDDILHYKNGEINFDQFVKTFVARENLFKNIME